MRLISKTVSTTKIKNINWINVEIRSFAPPLGHPTERVIKEGIKRGTITGTLIEKENLSFCPDCLRGKMSDLPEVSSETEYSLYGPLELVATDIHYPISLWSLQVFRFIFIQQ
jgi:hypothetical protein